MCLTNKNYTGRGQTVKKPHRRSYQISVYQGLATILAHLFGEYVLFYLKQKCTILFSLYIMYIFKQIINFTCGSHKLPCRQL